MSQFFRLLRQDRHVIFCPSQLVADTYVGCPHGCHYCYGPRASYPRKKNRRTLFLQSHLRMKSKNPEKNIAKLIQHARISPSNDPILNAISRNFPVRIGSVSEPFQPELEKRHNHTYRILATLGDLHYPYIVCTKSTLVTEPDYVDLIKRTRGIVQISLISLDKKLLQHLEPNAPSPQKRLDAMKTLVSEGIFTACRIQPVIPSVTENGMSELIDNLVSIGINHVIIEFLKLVPGEMKGRLKAVLKACDEHGIRLGQGLIQTECDLFAYYEKFPDVQKREGYIFFSKSRKARLMSSFVEMIKNAMGKYGTTTTFGSGDEETQYLNFTENCCGLDRVSGYSGYSTCTIQTMLKLAKEKGTVTLEDMKQFYNPFMDKFVDLWSRKEKNGRYWIENRVFKLRAMEVNKEVVYVHDESAVPS